MCFICCLAESKTMGTAIAIGCSAKTAAHLTSATKVPVHHRDRPKSRHYKPNNKPWKPTIRLSAKFAALFQAIHPFDLPGIAVGTRVAARLANPLDTLARLSQTYAPTQNQAALARWQRQIQSFLDHHAWWQWSFRLSGTDRRP